MTLLQSIRAPLLRWVLSGTTTVAKFQQFCGVTLPPNTSTPLKPSCAPSPSSAATKDGHNSSSDSPSPTDLPRGVPIISNRLAYIYFQTAAAAGNELFYIIFLPLLFWCVNVDLARRLSLLWGCVYASGQSVKDLLELPRPPSPPVARLESHYETEYGFPSTHAMIALVLPWYALVVWAQLGYDTNWTLGVVAATVWTVSITLSRLYVGVHSVCDLVGGLALGGLVLAFGWAFGASIDEFVIHSLASPPAALLVSYSVIYLYPAPASWTNAYGDTALIIATVAGISCASSDWTGRLPSIQSTLFDSKITLLGFMALRMIVGCTILFSTRAVMKLVAQRVWLPLILPKYFAFCSQLAAPTRVGGLGDEHADASPLSLREDSPRSNQQEQWELTGMDGTVPPPGLHQRGTSEPQRTKAAPVTVEAAAAPGVTLGAGALRRPVARPPQQFRLRVETGAFAAAVDPSAKLDLSRPSSPLDALLHGSSPPHTLRVSSDPTDPSSPALACFEAAGRTWFINPLHVYLVEVPIKYVTYFSVGFNAVFVCPLVFARMGI